MPAWRGVHCSSASALPSRLPHDQRWRYSSSLSSFLLTPWPSRRADQELLTPATGSLQPRLTLVNTAAAPRTGTSVCEKPCCAPVSSPPHRACSRNYQEGAYLEFRTTHAQHLRRLQRGHWHGYTPGQDSHRHNETASSPLSLASCRSIHRKCSVRKTHTPCGILISEDGSSFEGAGLLLKGSYDSAWCREKRCAVWM